MYFQCKIKADKMSAESGGIKQTSEVYLVDALTFAEAETRVLTEQAPYVSGSIEVDTCKKVNVSGLIDDDNPQSDKWYKVKVMSVNFDEEKQVEKKVANYFYVHAATLMDALKLLHEQELRHWQTDYDIVSATDTPIMDVYKFTANEKKN